MTARPTVARAIPLLLSASLLVLAACSRGDSSGTGNDAAALKNSGAAHLAKGEYAAAIHALDSAIALKPDFANAYSTRALAWQDSGEYARAIQDYDQAIRYKPDHASAMRGRARANFYLARFDAASRDLRAAQGLVARAGTPDTLDRPGAYAALWQFMSDARAGKGDTAALAQAEARMGGKWPAPVARLFLGRATPDEVMAIAAQADTGAIRDQRCAASFYLGELALVKHQATDAVQRFKAARDGCPKDWTEYQGAVAELAHLSPQT